LESQQNIMRSDYERRLAKAEREKDETEAALTDSLTRREDYYEKQV
jgi:hypothetical protein